MHPNFIPTTPSEIINNMIATYEQEYYLQTGEVITLMPANKERIELQVMASMIYQGYEYIQYGMLQNLADYSEGEYLTNLAKLLDVNRLAPQKAITTVKFILSAPQSSVMVIPAGIRLSAGNQMFFATKEAAIVEVGSQSASVQCEAVEAGEKGNGYLPGQINTLVDPLPFVVSVENTEISKGGADEESDDSLRYRFKIKPSSLSVAGPETAYEYFVLSYSQAIIDCKVSQTSPGVLDIPIILTNGELPTESFNTALEHYLNQYRPLTDLVTVSAAAVETYHIEMVYYISSKNAGELETIKAKVNEAISTFNYRQKTKIGKNIVPDELIKACLEAGASRTVIISPKFTVIAANKVAQVGTVVVTCGGVEDD